MKKFEAGRTQYRNLSRQTGIVKLIHSAAVINLEALLLGGRGGYFRVKRIGMLIRKCEKIP